MDDLKRATREEPLKRSFSVDKRQIDEEARTVEIAFSSEEPYERWFGTEVLDHSPQSVMLDRLNNGAAVLVNHDTNDQVGVVESSRIDSDKRGRAVVRFSRSARGEEIFQDVLDGIRQLVSVQYRVHKYDVQERDGQSDLVTITQWEPLEASFVAIPADATVGVGRSADSTKHFEKEIIMVDSVKEKEAPKQEQRQEAPAFDANAERVRLRSEEKLRMDSIRQAADRFNVGDLGRQAIDEDWSVEKFNAKALEVVGERNSAARAESQHDGEVDLSGKDRQRFSMIRLMDAISNPNDRTAQKRAAFELEVSAEAQRGFGNDFQCRGEFIPESVLSGQRTLTAGTATDGAEMVAENLLSGSYIEVLRNAMVTAQAGMTMLPGLVGNVEIPRQTSGAASTWISAEDGDATVSDPQFDQVTLSPKDLACFTEVSRRLLQQSTPAIEGIVLRDLAIAQALGIDKAVLYGTAANGQPRGIVSQTGINTLDLAAANPTYAEIIKIVGKVLADNAMMGSLRWMISPAGWEALKTTSKQASGVEGNFILGDSDLIAGYGWNVSNQVTAEEYFFGDWSQVLLGEWGGLEVNVDPYTHSLKGKIRYVTFKTCDVTVRHPESFVYAHDGIIP